MTVEERTALDLVERRIIEPLVSVRPGTPVVVALRTALSAGFNRIPVTEEGRAVGSIDLYTLEALAPEEGALAVRHAMAPPLPELDESVGEGDVAEVLSIFTEVLITRAGFPLGLLSRRDLARDDD
jgi:predicted transcriptional regulator